ncbi:MAG: hypothetical protein QGH15_08265 [Kiritimatiellia bacterium]|nr:hypothetical protein [Kiritimatiellia bacterium]
MKILAIVWIACSVTASSVTGMVLCIGADGHFSLEFANHDDCNQEPHDHANMPHESVQMRVNDAKGCCGDCIDVPLSPDIVSQLTEAVRHKRTTEETIIRPLTAPSVTVDELTTRASQSNLKRQAALSDSYAFLLSQRTTVLLI